MRALKGVHDADPAGQVWAEYMANTLLMAKQMMEQAAAQGRTRLPAADAGFIRSAYNGALAVGRDANAGQPGSKAAKLVERFARDADDILRFTTDTAIWFTNNQSERDLRPTAPGNQSLTRKGSLSATFGAPHIWTGSVRRRLGDAG